MYVVDDDFHVREALQAMIEARGLSVEVFGDGEAFLCAHDGDAAGCLLVDHNLPGISGLALIERLHAEGSRLPVILMSGRADAATRSAAEHAGAAAVMAKPLDPSELLAAIAAAGIELPTSP